MNFNRYTGFGPPMPGVRLMPPVTPRNSVSGMNAMPAMNSLSGMGAMPAMNSVSGMSPASGMSAMSVMEAMSGMASMAMDPMSAMRDALGMTPPPEATTMVPETTDAMYYDMPEYVDEGRQFVYAYNISTFVTGLTFLWGVMLAISMLSLVGYYFVSTSFNSTALRRRSFNTYGEAFEDSKEEEKEDKFLHILEQLEKAFNAFGVKSYGGNSKKRDGCQMRLICEVYLSDALKVNREASSVIARAISKLTPGAVKKLPGPELIRANDYLTAANRGRHVHDCSNYVDECPHLTLADLKPSKT